MCFMVVRLSPSIHLLDVRQLPQITPSHFLLGEARAQQGERMRRIGVLLPATENDPEFQARMRAFQQETPTARASAIETAQSGALRARERGHFGAVRARIALAMEGQAREFFGACGESHHPVPEAWGLPR
jgi:hypothetical protein